MVAQQSQTVVPPGYDAASLRAAVRDRYGTVGSTPAAGFNFRVGADFAEALGYDAIEVAAAPPGSTESFTGVAAIIHHADLAPGERVLDLGCGAGLDLSLASARVGATGCIVGLDMAPSMAKRAVHARGSVPGGVCLGYAEALPLGPESVDAVIANGILNLAPDKSAILSEIARVLRPGGRLILAETTIRDGETPPPITNIDDWFR